MLSRLGLFLSLILISFPSFANLKNDASLYVSYGHNSRIFLEGEEAIDVRQTDGQKSNYTIGGSYNSIRTDFTSTLDGYKINVSYELFSDRFFSPYIGGVYIFGTGKTTDQTETGGSGTVRTKLDGIDGVVGVSLTLGWINPYVEHFLYQSYSSYGVRLRYRFKVD